MYSSGSPINIPVSLYQGASPTGSGTLEGNYYMFDYGARNSARMTPFHKLDVSATKQMELWYLPAELTLGLYNIYNRANASIYYMGNVYDRGQQLWQPRLKAVSLFPVLPSVSLKIHF